MDKILYRYLLRRLFLFPVTFSRNKNYEHYNSEEGKEALKNSKILHKIIKHIENNENIKFEFVNNQHIITIINAELSLNEEYILNQFEYELLKEHSIFNQ